MRLVLLVVFVLTCQADASLIISRVSPNEKPPVVLPEGSGPARAVIQAFLGGQRTSAVLAAKKLAEKEDADALFLLGFAAEYGQGSPYSPERALKYYARSATAGNQEAVLRRAIVLLRSPDRAAREEGRIALEASSTDPSLSGPAGRVLGEAWLGGLLTDKPDFEHAVQWWQRAAQAGDKASLLLLAQLFEGAYGFPEKKNLQKSIEHYKVAANRGERSAITALGSRLLNGDPSIRNEAEGRKWLEKAIESGQASAYIALGAFEENSRKDDSAALQLYRKGAEAGNVECIVRTAGFLLAGRGIKKDEKSGRMWLRKAAQEGNGMAAVDLAGRMTRDQPASDPLEIYRLLLRPAQSGFPLAQNELALFYLSGLLGESDSAAGVAWLTRAAKAGHAAAQNNLATLYETGEGVPVNFVNALDLYRMAAYQGHSGATGSLARLFAHGHGTGKNLAKAWAWASLAAERGDKASVNMVTSLAVELGPDGLIEAAIALRELKGSAAAKGER